MCRHDILCRIFVLLLYPIHDIFVISTAPKSGNRHVICRNRSHNMPAVGYYAYSSDLQANVQYCVAYLS